MQGEGVRMVQLYEALVSGAPSEADRRFAHTIQKHCDRQPLRASRLRCVVTKTARQAWAFDC